MTWSARHRASARGVRLHVEFGVDLASHVGGPCLPPLALARGLAVDDSGEREAVEGGRTIGVDVVSGVLVLSEVPASTTSRYFSRIFFSCRGKMALTNRRCLFCVSSYDYATPASGER